MKFDSSLPPTLIVLIMLAKHAWECPVLCAGLSVHECFLQTPSMLFRSHVLAFLWCLSVVWYLVSILWIFVCSCALFC